MKHCIIRTAVLGLVAIQLLSLLAGCAGGPTAEPGQDCCAGKAATDAGLVATTPLSATAEPDQGCCAGKAATTEPGQSCCSGEAGTAEPGQSCCLGEASTAEPGQSCCSGETAPDTSLTAFITADFSGAGTCSLCHAGLKDQAGADVSLMDAWRSTMMANAAKDPVWQAKVSSEVRRTPAIQAVIEGKCATCHMPMAKTQAAAEGQAVAVLGEGFSNPASALYAAAMDGVSCTLCHQVGATGLGTKETFSGGYAVDTSTEPPDRVIFGPYEEPFVRPMQMHTGFVPTYGTHTGSAELCATCHNVYTPYADAQGNVLGEFPEQTPYTEWENSSFGTAGTPCQGCHMPQAKGGVVISTMPPTLAARQPFFQHFFVGGNSLVLKILRDWGGELGVTADAGHLNTTLGRVTDMVGQRSASLNLKSLDLEGGTLTAELQVTPMTGHKFPTGFPGRRAWLHITVTDATGQVLFESGKLNADGTISGNSADADPTAFEPHYDLITQADQVQIYEPILGDTDGHVTYTLLRGAQYLKDNRLLPQGMDKAKLPADIAVYGEAAEDASFLGGGDLVTYQVDVQGTGGPFTVSAELLYEPLSYQFIQDLLLDQAPLVERLGAYYRATDKTPLVVAAIQPATTK